MPNNIKMTKKRKNDCIRDPKGRFQQWKGSKKKSNLKKPKQNFHGTAIHIGKEFTKQNNRKAVVGDLCRKKNKDGSYHKSSEFYLRTKNGWRSTHEQEKPTSQQKKKLLNSAKKGH